MVGFSSCTVLFSDNRAVAHLHGELDAYSVRCLRARLMPIAMTGRDIVIDLNGVDFVDTAGLVALIDLQREARRAGGSLRLTKPPRPLRRLLQLAGIKNVFTIVDHVPTG
jgi:anti-sigma B factor antagonist